MSDFYSFEALDINAKMIKMSEFSGKVVLVVNTASRCGFTPQFEKLEHLYLKYQEQGFVILGFPCNQFMNQDPGSEEQIKEFCTLNYKVTFPLFSKVDVNSSKAHPLFVFLKKQAPGMLGSQVIKWNFTKFLIDRNGKVCKRFAPSEIGQELEDEILKVIKNGG